MPKLNAFLDLDGPILDVSQRHYRVYGDIVTGFGATPVPLSEFWSAKRQKVSDEAILARSGVAARLAEYTEQKLELIEADSYLELDQLQPRALHSLMALAERYSLVLVTLRRSRPSLEKQLTKLQLDRCLNHVLTSVDDASAERGQGWAIKHRLIVEAGMNAGPGDFFAGDTETDILAGKNLGTKTVAVTNGIRDERFLRALDPTLIVASIAELAASNLVAG